ncbi:YdcP family protein [Bacillus sp. SD075]|uniref:YdcP family protein n=1 Tax=Bacillus sp. SD075 TaxID=2781732 RepID=UPI001A9736F7|nr:YdcP family protein [Bacillus sp. SD075]MBO1000539.1 YdcP family protein [Bacillus sp. SD075]
MELKYIVPDIEKTFGAMNFLGHNRDRFQYDRVNNRRTDVLEARVYNLGSSGQGGQIEVTIPGEVELKELDFNEPVELVNPMITSSAQANGNFATVRWTVTADDIVSLKSRSASTGSNSVKTLNGSGDEKK